MKTINEQREEIMQVVKNAIKATTLIDDGFAGEVRDLKEAAEEVADTLIEKGYREIMKSVLLSIRPEWCEKIVSGEKTIEVRKRAPQEAPFKCYIYCSYGNDRENYMLGRQGKIIGEFICDKVMFLTPLGLRGFEMREEILKSICLTNDDLNAYGGLKTLYGWHISALKIYDKPRELSEFYTPLRVYKNARGERVVGGSHRVTRPPQSWCYVEGKWD